MKAVNGLFDVVTHCTVDRGQGTIDISVGHLSGSVTGDEWHVETGVFNHVAQFAEICLVVRVGTIFVFHLHHDDGATVGHGEALQLFAQTVDIAFASIEKLLVVAAPHHAFFVLQPIGVTAKVPFGTNVGTGAQDYVHSLLAANFYEFCEVGLSRKVKHARLALMDIPKNVGRHRVDAHGFGSLNAVAPIFCRNARIVHFTADELNRLAVVDKRSVFNFEFLGVGSRKAHAQKRKHQDKSFFHGLVVVEF